MNQPTNIDTAANQSTEALTSMHRGWFPRNSAEWLCLLLPILGIFKIDFIGELYVHEMLLVALLAPLLLSAARLGLTKQAVTIVVFGSLWLSAQILTDYIRDTPVNDSLRGTAKIIFFILAFLALCLLLIDKRRVFLWIMGSSVAFIARPYRLFPDDFDLTIYWKFGLGLGIALILSFRSLYFIFNDSNTSAAYRRLMTIQLAVCVASFFINARSLAGICAINAFFIWLLMRNRGRTLSSASVIAGIGIIAAAGLTIVAIYIYGARSGVFGIDALMKLEQQASVEANPFLVMLSGRSESLVSLVAIADSPIIGHGSWAKDYKYVSLLVEYRSILLDADSSGGDITIFGGLIPSHSFVFGSWVDAGIAGGIFWFVIVYLLLFRFGPLAFARGNEISVYFVLTAPTLLWNIFFSPFGANMRVEVAGMLAIFCLLEKTSRDDRP